MEENSTVERLLEVNAGRAQAIALQPGVIEACRRGERDAFGVLFDAYKDRVYSVALHYTANETAAHDITQDVFVKLFSAISGFRGAAGFHTWLFRLVVNTCMDEHRRTKRLVSLEDAKDRIQPPVQHMEAQAEIAGQVATAVSKLAPKLRLPILLRHIEGLSYDEIAEVLGCSAGTVASRLNRAHKQLAARLEHLRGAL